MKTVVLAFSGGLDTSFCVSWLRHEAGARVVTVTVDTGGFGREELRALEARALALGAARHVTIDGRQTLFDRVLRWLIAGNVLRGHVYPLSVSCERVVQAEGIVSVAREERAGAIAHGSTGAGNDQVRFDVAFAVLAPGLEVLAPIRSLGMTRERSAAYLAEHGFPVPADKRDYSVNAGLWGTTIGGRESHDPWAAPPEAAYPAATATGAEEVTLAFERGVPVALDGERLPGAELVARLEARAAAHGVGRGVHLGDTILGIKGRVFFQAGAALVLVEAHRELEKLVLTRWQAYHKDQLAAWYGMALHEGRWFDPSLRDVEAYLESSQRRVTGEARVRLADRRAEVVGCRSPHSLLRPDLARYGETHALWTGEDAAAFGKLYGLQEVLWARAGEDVKK